MFNLLMSMISITIFFNSCDNFGNGLLNFFSKNMFSKHYKDSVRICHKASIYAESNEAKIF